MKCSRWTLLPVVEWRRRHTPPLTQNFGAAIFRRFFPTLLFLFTILVANGQRFRHVTGRLGCGWFYLYEREWVEPHVVCSCLWGAVLCPLFLLCDRPLARCCRRRRSRFMALRSWLLVLWKASLRTTMMIVFEQHPLYLVGLWKINQTQNIVLVCDVANALWGKISTTHSF